MAVNTDKRKYLQPEMVAVLNSMALRARLVVEGYIIGQHRSPYHGFSVEFAEHRAYGPGDEIRHIDWRLFGKTERLYVKRYEEETNLRTHIILDTSRSMLYKSLTRAHLMAVVVSETVDDGWLAFLRRFVRKNALDALSLIHI